MQHGCVFDGFFVMHITPHVQSRVRGELFLQSIVVAVHRWSMNLIVIFADVVALL